MAASTRLAIPTDVSQIVALSSRVQDHLSASGSLQVTGPLAQSMVEEAMDGKSCFVLVSTPENPDRVIGCAFVRSLAPDHYATTSTFNIQDFQQPWSFLHALMLDPDLQGRGIGLPFLQHVFTLLRGGSSAAGTVVLDCWAGNEKLRAFYERARCEFVDVIPEKDYEIAVFVKSLGSG